MRSKLLHCSLWMLASCASGDDASSETSTSNTGSMSATASTSATTSMTGMMDTSSSSTIAETTTSMDGAPFFISFSTNVSQITEGESVVFTAILGDPDGFGDIAGGALFTEDGAFSYGAFVSAGQEGTYSLTVSWEEVDQVADITFESVEVARVFRAEFFDKGGDKVSRNTSITLHCEGGGACGGLCKDLQSDGTNCGGCGIACEGGCSDALCLPVLGECIDEAEGFPTCDAYCQSVGEQCVVDGCGGATIVAFGDTFFCMDDSGAKPQKGEPCDFIQTWDLGRSVIRCCCSDTN